MATVFISYAREDQAFVRSLYDDLKRHGHEVWVDWQGIPPSADYFTEIQRAIDNSDAVLVVISPELVASRVCGEELAHALAANKRLIPLHRRGTRSAAVNESLRRLNWIDFRDEVDQSAAVATLVDAIETDLDWVLTHTRLLVRAVEWEQRGHDASLLFRGRALREAEDWIANAGPDKDPQPTQGQRQFLLASRRASSARQRRLIGAAALAVIVSLTLAVLAFLQRQEAIDQRGIAVVQRQEAVAQRKEAETQRAEAEYQRGIAVEQEAQARSRALAANAEAQLGKDPELSIRLSMEALQVAQTGEAATALRQSLGESHVRAVLKGHTNSVRNVYFSRDGSRVYSGGYDGVVIAWNSTTGAMIWKTESVDYPLALIRMSPDGSMIAGAAADGNVWLWRADTGAVVAEFTGHTDIAWSVAFSPDGTRLGSASADGTVRVWDIATKQLVVELNGQSGSLNDLAFSPDGKEIAAGSDQNTVMIWSVPDGKLLHSMTPTDDTSPLFEGEYAIFQVQFSPDGASLLTENYDGTARLWSASTGALTLTLSEPLTSTGVADSFVSYAVFSPDGKTIATGYSDGVVRFWDASSGAREAEFRGLVNLVAQVVYSADGSRVAAASWDGTARVWEAGSGVETAQLASHTDYVDAIAIDALGSKIATGSRDHTVRIWEADTGSIATLYGAETMAGESAGFTADGNVVTADFYGTTSRWDAQTGKQIGSNATYLRQNLAAWWYAAFSPDGTMVAGSDLATKDVVVWDPATGKEIAVFGGNQDTVNAIAWSPDGRLLAIGGWDMTLKIWDVTTQKLLFAIKNPDAGNANLSNAGVIQALAFSPDGKTIALGGNDQGIQLWDSVTGTLQGELDVSTQPIVYSLAYSADGSRIAVGSGDNVVRIWDVAAQRVTQEMRGHTTTVMALAFTPDGGQIVSGDMGGEMRIWDATTGEQLAVLHGHADQVRSIRFNADGTSILSVAKTGPARLTPCDVCGPVSRLLTVAEARGTRELTADERQRYEVVAPAASPVASPVSGGFGSPAATPVASPVG